MRSRCFLALALVALLPAASAAAGGLPPTEAPAGRDGVVGPGGAVRFGAVWTPDHTVVTKAQIRGGRLLRTELLEGHWGIPVVANDWTAGGLSADGETLVLVRAPGTYPPRRTTLAVLGTGRFAVRRTIELKGKWTFDALSPDASTLYLVQTLDARGSRYAVRAYDMRAGRLLPDPIVDPSEPDEPMRGYPLTRVTAPGGRWEYTLYTGDDHPFIHALDTVGRTSLCLDLPDRAVRHPGRTRLALRAGRVQVIHRGRVVASAPRRPQQASAGGGSPWALIALGLAGAFVAAGGVRRALRAG
jgi:hypothetical protein